VENRPDANLYLTEAQGLQSPIKAENRRYELVPNPKLPPKLAKLNQMVDPEQFWSPRSPHRLLTESRDFFRIPTMLKRDKDFYKYVFIN
jgi:hypothetical protein